VNEKNAEMEWLESELQITFVMPASKVSWKKPHICVLSAHTTSDLLDGNIDRLMYGQMDGLIDGSASW